MAFDGIVTAAAARELRDRILYGRISKVYQPESDELVLNIYTQKGNVRVYATVDSAAACIRIIDQNPVNPPQPLPFCMLLRKHLQGGRIVAVEQKDSERIIEITLETLNELGFTVSKKLIFEIMGKYSNIILTDLATGKVVDSMKRISIDMDRARQILPGKIYTYPPAQNKIPFRQVTPEEARDSGETWKAVLSRIGGISPGFARELVSAGDRFERLQEAVNAADSGDLTPVVYVDDEDTPKEFYFQPLREYEESCRRLDFSTLSEAAGYYFEHKRSSNRARQKSHDLVRSVSTRLDKLYLKKQRLEEDLLRAENSEDLRLFGELLTANMHLMHSGMKEITVTNYYNGEEITIPLDPRWTPNKNAQSYFKRYGKAKTAIHEKKAQLTENQENIDYLESVLTYLNNTNEITDIEDLRTELEDTGFVRARKQSHRPKKKKFRADPLRYTTSDGFPVLVGRNNRENDQLTLHTASRTDYWFHTKDIPGSHVIVQTQGREITETAIFEAAALAAYHSKARTSENVPVDYVQVKHVKKPNGAKPGMVIFTDNRTVYVNPKELPEMPRP